MTRQATKAQVAAACTKRLQALESHVAAGTTIALNGRKMPLADVVAIYQGRLDTAAVLAAKREETKIALAADRSAERARLDADKALRAWVATEFGAESREALAFGFPPAKKPVRTAQDKADAAKLAQATREARHTLGPKERLKIKGTLPPAATPEETS
jgi:hypothetical protein